MELSKGTGVFVSIREKKQIKVDYADKPHQLAKEALFAIFGREAFSSLTVTARGKRTGSFGIKPNVIAAVLGT